MVSIFLPKFGCAQYSAPYKLLWLYVCLNGMYFLLWGQFEIPYIQIPQCKQTQFSKPNYEIFLWLGVWASQIFDELDV